MTTPSHTQQPVGIDSALPSDHDAAPIRAVRPPAAASLAGLATVELQLIMHYCDLSTLLALARCSRFTLHAASDPFAWRALSPLELAFVHTAVPDTGAEQRRLIDSAWQWAHRWFLFAPRSPQPLSLSQRLCGSLLRFTLSAGSSPLAWSGLSPLSRTFIRHPLARDAGTKQQRPIDSAWLWARHWLLLTPLPLPPPSLAQRLSASLLRFRDIKIMWNFDRNFLCYPVSDAELDGLAAIPRLRVLDSHRRWTAGPALIAALVQRPGLRELRALICDGDDINEQTIGALADHCPRLSTIATCDATRTDPPLHLLPALTDLTVHVRHEGGLTMATVLRCDGLRRLSISPDSSNRYTSRDVHTGLFSPSLRTLEHLAVHNLDALHADGRKMPAAQLDWAVAFASLPALRSLVLEDSRGIDELLAAIGAGCAQLHSLDISSCAMECPGSLGTGDPLPSAAVLSALLARRPSLRSVALILLGLHGSLSSIQDRARTLVWRNARAELSALEALHRSRLGVTLPADNSLLSSLSMGQA